MYRLAHSAPDHSNSPDPSTSDFHHHTSEQTSTHLQPLMASRTHRNPISQGKHDHVAATPPNSYPPTPGTLESGNASNNANAHGRKLASHYIHEGTSYDPSNAKEDYLRMAKDDVPDNKVSPASTASACLRYFRLTRRSHCPRWPVSTSTSLVCPELHAGEWIFSPEASTLQRHFDGTRWDGRPRSK